MGFDDADDQQVQEAITLAFGDAESQFLETLDDAFGARAN